MSRTALRCLGVLFWIGLAVVGYAAVRTSDQDGDTTVASLVRYLAGPTARIVALDPSSQLRVHDPVFLQHDDGSWSQVGFVESVAPLGGQLTLAWHSRQVAAQQCRFDQYHNSGRLDEVVATMLPPQQRLQIQERLAAALSRHGDELAAAFVPLIQQSLQRSLPIIEEEFRVAVDRHRDEIDQLVARWNDEVVGDHLIPLARREILPIVREHAQPQAEAIGRELWDRASIWRFGWRAVYDKSPLPRKDLVQEEWDRFVQEQAVPVFEDHIDEIVVALQRVVRDVAANDRVRRELANVANEIAADPEARQLVRTILRETLLENERLRAVWSEIWTSDEARHALELAGDRLEPVVRQIGDDLFGTQQDGINPNFARVLRNQILGKDRRWIVARHDALAARREIPTITPASEPMPYPIVYMADRDRHGSDQP